MNRDAFVRYGELKIIEAQTTEELDLLKPLVLKQTQEFMETHVDPATNKPQPPAIEGLGKFGVGTKTKVVYNDPEVTRLELELERAKEKAERMGNCETIVISTFPKFTKEK